MNSANIKPVHQGPWDGTSNPNTSEKQNHFVLTILNVKDISFYREPFMTMFVSANYGNSGTGANDNYVDVPQTVSFDNMWCAAGILILQTSKKAYFKLHCTVMHQNAL